MFMPNDAQLGQHLVLRRKVSSPSGTCIGRRMGSSLHGTMSPTHQSPMSWQRAYSEEVADGL